MKLTRNNLLSASMIWRVEKDIDKRKYIKIEKICSAVEELRKRGFYYDKMTRKKLSVKIAKGRKIAGLVETMFFVIDEKEIDSVFEKVNK